MFREMQERGNRMKQKTILRSSILIVLVILLIFGGYALAIVNMNLYLPIVINGKVESPSPTSTKTPTDTPTITPTLTISPSTTPTLTNTPTQTPTEDKTEQFFSQLDDGEVLYRFCSSDWSTCRNSSMGNAGWDDLTVGTVGATFDHLGYTIQRMFFFFDTSSIPTNAQIKSAILHVYAGQYQNGNKTIHVVPSKANIPLGLADFSNTQFESGGSVTPSSPFIWMQLNFNSTALNWINKGDITKLALIHHLDLNNTAPTVPNDVLLAMTEDNQYRPFLEVTYYLP